MRSVSHAAHVERPLRITLELEPGAEPIAGRLYADDRPRRSFYGWLEFAAAIESAYKEPSIEQPSGACSGELGGQKP